MEAQRAAAFFDLDKTVIARASMVAFGRPFRRAGLISRRLLVRALYAQLVYLFVGADEARIARMRDMALRLTRGWEQARVRAIVRDTLPDVIDPIVYDEAMELIRDHQRAGRPVYIVSASPEEIVEPLAGYLRVDGYIATRSRVDADGRYAGEMEFYCYGPHKAEAMHTVATRDGIDLAASYAYSDSATDVPMLECVGHPVAVNADRELARRARAAGWELRTFSRRVRLWDRVPRPAAGPTAAVGGGVAVVAAAAAVWWWLRKEPATPPPTRWQRLRASVALRTGPRRSAPSSPRTQPSRRGSRGGEASSWRASLLSPRSPRLGAASADRAR